MEEQAHFKATKFRLMDCLVIPIALYGCETWTLNKADRKKLQSFETKCLRKILGVTWREHITNKEILTRSSRDAGHLLKKRPTAPEEVARPRIANARSKVT